MEAKPRQQKWLRFFIRTQRPVMVLPLVAEFSRGAWLSLAAAALAACVLGSILAHAPDIYEAPAPKGFRNWLTAPIEFHPEMQLANFDDLNLEAVTVATDNAGRERLFVAGENALLAFSDDRGRTWTRVYYDPQMGGFAVRGKGAPPPVTPTPANRTTGTPAPGNAAAASPGTKGTSSTTPPSKSPAGKTKRGTLQGPSATSPKQSPAQQQLNPPPAAKKPAAKSAATLFSWPSLVPSVLAAEILSDRKQPSSGTASAASQPLGATKDGGSSTATSAPALTPKGLPDHIHAICRFADGRLVLLMSEGDPTYMLFRGAASNARVVLSTDFGETWGADNPGKFLDRQSLSNEGLSFTQFLNGKIYANGTQPNRFFFVTAGGIVIDKVLGDTVFFAEFGAPKDPDEPPFFPQSVFLSIDGQAWAVSNQVQLLDRVYRKESRDAKWVESIPKPGAALNDIAFTSDGATGYVVGGHGGIWRWQKNNNQWLPITRGALNPGQTTAATATYWRLPPPWAYPVLFLAFGWFVIAVAISAVPGANTLQQVSAWVDSPATPVDPTASVARISVSDRPLGEDDVDHLGFRSIARGVAGFLRNPKTQLPVTLAINGDWGSGKSSLMNLICGELRRARFRPVWFNAWHHQEDENLLASLLQSVRQEAAPPVLSRGGLAFRCRLGWFRFIRYYPRALAMAAVFMGLWAAESWYDAKDKNNAPQLRQYLEETGHKLQELTLPSQPPDTSKGVPAQPPTAATQKIPASSANSGSAGSTQASGSANQQASREGANNGQPKQNNAPPGIPLLATLINFLALLHSFLDGASENVGTKSLPALYFLVRMIPSALAKLKAFQTDPASLLHTAAPGVSRQQIEAQTSFRMRFAKEFSDVTHALGQNHRLVIFVDDLDRCRPGKVAEIMEAINYVTVSGDCAFILGIETHVVQAALALSFNAMAQEIRFDQNSASASASPNKEETAEEKQNSDPAPAPTKEEMAEKRRARRELFAKRYVEKLINIEMQVPSLDLAKKQAFFAVDEKSPLVPEYFATARRLAGFGRWLEPVAAFLLVIALGWSAGRGIVWYAEQRAEKHYRALRDQAMATAQRNAAPVRQTSAGASVDQNQTPTAAPSAAQAAQSKPDQIPEMLSGEQPWPEIFFRSPASWALILFAMLWAAQLLTREPLPPAKDSENFARALTAWGWVAGAGLATPRATKRFLNRLRFLAMRQHPPSVQLPGLLKIMLSAEEQRRALALEQQSAGGPSNSAIADDLLVALASLEAYRKGAGLSAADIAPTFDELSKSAVDAFSKGDLRPTPFLADLARLADPSGGGLAGLSDEKARNDTFGAMAREGKLAVAAKNWGSSTSTVIQRCLEQYRDLGGEVKFT